MNCDRCNNIFGNYEVMQVKSSPYLSVTQQIMSYSVTYPNNHKFLQIVVCYVNLISSI